MYTNNPADNMFGIVLSSPPKTISPTITDWSTCSGGMYVAGILILIAIGIALSDFYEQWRTWRKNKKELTNV